MSGTAIVMVVQPGERNSFDQRLLEYAVWREHRIPMLRKSLLEIQQHAQTNDSRALVIDGQEACRVELMAEAQLMQIAVAYFRAGYAPKDYPSDAEWDGRRVLERSRAIKCPNIADHLSGSKKVQQVLAQESVLARYDVCPASSSTCLMSDGSFLSGEALGLVRSTFAGLYSLDADTPHGAAIAHAIQHPDLYVLKPQREGGGWLHPPSLLLTSVRQQRVPR